MGRLDRKGKSTGNRVCTHPLREERRARAQERSEYNAGLSLEAKLKRAHDRKAAGMGNCAKEIARLERQIQERDAQGKKGKRKAG